MMRMWENEDNGDDDNLIQSNLSYNFNNSLNLQSHGDEVGMGGYNDINNIQANFMPLNKKKVGVWSRKYNMDVDVDSDEDIDEDSDPWGGIKKGPPSTINLLAEDKSSMITKDEKSEAWANFADFESYFDPPQAIDSFGTNFVAAGTSTAADNVLRDNYNPEEIANKESLTVPLANENTASDNEEDLSSTNLASESTSLPLSNKEESLITENINGPLERDLSNNTENNNEM